MNEYTKVDLYYEIRKVFADVKLGDKITQKEADQLLADNLVIYENAVNRLVKVDLDQDMFDALVSFTYNVGIGANCPFLWL